MDRSAGPQQPLEINSGMKLAMVILLGIGLASSIARRMDHSDDEAFGLFTEPPSIVRTSGQPIPFPHLGVIVTPKDGWSHLLIESRPKYSKPTFVNESMHVIATLNRFPFSSWPPTPKALQSNQERMKENEMLLDRAVITQSKYEHVAIQWLDLNGESQFSNGLRYGRLVDEPIDLLITFMEHSPHPNSEDTLTTFCNGIRPIE